MQSIEDLAIQTYQKNVEYLSMHHPQVAKTLDFFNIALENGDYIPTLDLEYINEYFNVKIIDNNQWLYASDSNKISQSLADLINFQKNSYCFEGLPVYHTDKTELNTLDDKKRGLSGVYPLMNYFLENSDNNAQMKEIHKFIFVGVGLGLNIKLVDEKISAKEYLIIEDNFELFRLSLFTTSYYEIANRSKIYFSIAENENSFLETMQEYLENSFYHNRHLKYLHFPSHSNNKIKQLQNAIINQAFITFPYRIQLEKFLRPLEYTNNGYNILDLSKHFTNGIFSKKPVLLIAAGPSFKKNLKWLKENHHRFITICVSATLNTLYNNEIVPDIVTHIDGFETSLVHYEDFPAKEFLKNSIVILGPFAPLKLHNIFSKTNIFRYEENTQYFKDFGSIVVPCIGSFSMLLSLMLNSTDLYLLGLDLALDQATGMTHSDDHAYNQRNDLSKKGAIETSISLNETIFPVQGNFRDTVYTTAMFHSSVQALYSNISAIKQNHQNIYNLNDGAKIELAFPASVKDINVEKYKPINKQILFDEIYTSLSKHSKTNLDEDDINSLKTRLLKTQEIQTIIDEYTNGVQYINPDHYLYELGQVITKILQFNERESYNLSHIYYHYFKYALAITVDFFNTKGLKNSKRHMKKIDKIIQQEMYDIITMYEKALSDFLQNKC